jgi:hypothetical protein
MQYHNYLKFSAIRERVRGAQHRIYGRARGYMNLHYYEYIEKLINKPICTHRNYCVWKILVPYYINVKGLSKLQTFDIVKSWLDKCNSIARLDFSPKQKIDYELDHVGKFTPICQCQLKEGHPKLYVLLEKEGIISERRWIISYIIPWPRNRKVASCDLSNHRTFERRL